MYRMIVFDVDGTLLNSRHELSPGTAEAVAKAAAAGKQVAFCTGRAPIELRGLPEQLPGIRYAILNNGAALWDLWENRKLYRVTLEPSLMTEIMNLADPEPFLTQYYTDGIQYSCLDPERLSEVGMIQYLPMYQRLRIPVVPDLRYRPVPVEKLALHFPGQASRLRAKARIEAAKLPVSINYGNKFTLEFTVPGCTKGFGLQKLCGHLGISAAEVIAVGDSENDNEAIRTAGLGIAMGNSTEELKKLADVQVADNDHGGCAEAIYQYLL